MPKALQKRGRRMKRKHEDEPEELATETSPKRQKANHDTNGMVGAEQNQMSSLEYGEDMSGAYPGGAEKAFFGVLDEQEQEFFKNADSLLEQNDFPNAEERAAFLQSVFREADDKALKLAQSQSCSRVLERLIKLSTASQLKGLFQKFSGNFIHLLSHRFASHCCESLFTYAAPYVSEELKAKPSDLKSENADEIFVSMENLFLHTLAELEGNFGYLLTERYASHALRILLLVLAGEPISTDSMKTLLRSKRKEGVPGKGGEEATGKSRAVPKSFSTALEKLISDSVAGLDTDKLRGLSTHPNANPTLQVLLTLELTHYGKQRGKDDKSIIRTLLPDEPFTADSNSAGFLSGLVYDPIGSHLVEKIIEHAPSKLFKSMYKSFFKERLASHARNEVATHVVCRILERLGYDDLLEAHEILVPEIPGLLSKHWTAMTQTIIERCTVRDIDTQAIAVQIDQFYSSEKGFDIAKMLRADEKDGGAGVTAPNGGAGTGSNGAATFFPRPTESTKVQFNILAQAMLIVPGSLSALVLDSLISLEKHALLAMAKDYIVTRTLQQALTTKNASMVERRKLVARFQGNIGEMALDKSASHVVDCIWEGTHGLAFIRERIAEELAENEASLRDSPSGRAVWKNWKMDIYKRRRQEWVRQSRIKASNDGFQAFSEIEAQKEEGVKKTPLQIARERHVQNKIKSEKKEKDVKQETKSESGDVKVKKEKGSRSSKSSNGSMAGPSTRPQRVRAAAATS
ncbi:Putative nucleolar protein [Septoria linicola]|uniref:Nucleolar protein 9 n=1 Tax=Septoria linicola TaxID=215465 RepID=A0A9Q9B125_9PEZI|nr:putative nucleolar protein [Septoria linicola]USW58959.1 Putative nucleolar protein [Septoria linicola]